MKGTCLSCVPGPRQKHGPEVRELWPWTGQQQGWPQFVPVGNGDEKGQSGGGIPVGFPERGWLLGQGCLTHRGRKAVWLPWLQNMPPRSAVDRTRIYQTRGFRGSGIWTEVSAGYKIEKGSSLPGVGGMTLWGSSFPQSCPRSGWHSSSAETTSMVSSSLCLP